MGRSLCIKTPMQRYMSPYQQGVIDVQKEQAFRDANRMRSDIGSDKQHKWEVLAVIEKVLLSQTSTET